MSTDGRFRVGALTGSWAKESAQYVGEGARGEARRVRITELRSDIDELEAKKERLAHAHRTVAERRRVLDSELAAVPGDDALRHDHATVAAAADAAHRARTRHGERAADLAEVAGKADEAAAELTETAADMNLPADRAGLAWSARPSPTTPPCSPRCGHRAADGDFLQEQIARRQADDSSGSWLEDLTAALDYRAWHEFGVERHQHGKWVPATGPASGGERVLAASVPLFAAASSHYASAGGPCRGAARGGRSRGTTGH